MRGLLKIILIVALCLVAVGCRFRSASQSIQATNDMSELSGTVVHRGHVAGTPIVVMLMAVNPDTGKVHAIKAYEVLDEPQEFSFMARPGKYSILAFEDTNGDLDYQRDEFIGWQQGTLNVSPGRTYPGLRIVLQESDDLIEQLPAIYRQAPDELEADYAKRSFGDIIPLDDPQFSDDYGTLGMWNPFLFMRRVKTGVSFLEPYDPNKIPVLFVHGVAGHPGHWQVLAASLDRTKYQPWFLYYPSFFRLNRINDFAANLITDLRDKYQFDTLYIVAHSMGGLVARGAINKLAKQDGATYIKHFVSISSPWGGHAMAELGVDHSPIVLPVWLDMKPNSLYIRQMHAMRLPRHIRYDLFFGHKGGLGIMAGESSDGTISLRSQLDPRAQDTADSLRGFDEGHRAILDAPEVANHLRIVFDQAETPEKMTP